MDWKKGDLVRLKSSGPNMTVMDVSDEGIRCWWFDKDKHREKVFPDWALVEAESRTTLTVVHRDETLGDDPRKS